MTRIEVINNILRGHSTRLRQSFFEKNYKELFEEINKFTYRIENISFKERLWYWVNNIKDRPLCNCGSKTSFNKNWLNGYKKHCSPKCAQNNVETKEKRKKTTLKKWGVDNVAKSEQVKNKQEQTNLEKWGYKSTFQNIEVQKKWKDTVKKKWNVEHPSQLESTKEKIKKTNIEKWGEDHFSKTEKFKERVKKLNNEKWGVDWYTQTEEFKEKSRETTLKKWGVDWYTQTEEFKERMKKYNIEKWDVDWFYQSEEFKTKSTETSLEKYGTRHHMMSIDKNRLKKSNRSKWGVDWYTQTEEFKIKSKKTALKKWNIGHYSKTEEFKERVKNTSVCKWGVTNYSKTEESKRKSRENSIKKYGVDNISKDENYRIENYEIARDENYIRYVGESYSLFKCDNGESHEFTIHIDNYIKRKIENNFLCTVCYPIGDLKSNKEIELYKWIKSIYRGEVLNSYRDTTEIDIYIPDKKIGFEFNGLFWHSDNFKDKYYHIDKTNFFKKRGIRIVHIWEDDWKHKKDILKSQITNWLGLVKNRIPARKCKIVEIDDIKIASSFLNSNHIQGTVGSNLKLGLYHNSELVSLMTFDKLEGRSKMSDNQWNINRFCNKKNTIVIGGASKLFKYFLKKYKVERVISYSDCDWSMGNLYKELGFKQVKVSKPDYKYLYNKKRVHKSKFKKSKTGISESKLNIPKIWDCGKIKFEYVV